MFIVINYSNIIILSNEKYSPFPYFSRFFDIYSPIDLQTKVMYTLLFRNFWFIHAIIIMTYITHKILKIIFLMKQLFDNKIYLNSILFYVNHFCWCMKLTLLNINFFNILTFFNLTCLFLVKNYFSPIVHLCKFFYINLGIFLYSCLFFS